MAFLHHLFHVSPKLNDWFNTQIGMSFSYPGDIITHNNATYISFLASLLNPHTLFHFFPLKTFFSQREKYTQLYINNHFKAVTNAG